MGASVWQVHGSWLTRATLVLVVTALAEVAVVWIAPQPVLWVALIAGTLPISMYFCVASPLLRRASGKPAL